MSDSKERKSSTVQPRDLPERHEAHGDPFEQLNAGSEPVEEKRAGVIQPRSLPEKDRATILEAARMLQEGSTHAEVARHLRIEPLQLRNWETAYSSEFQRDLNDGDYHDTDAQLRDLEAHEKERFQGNWEQVTEKSTQRRVKVGSVRAKLLANPATRWMFRNEHGDIDYGTIVGIFVAVLGVSVALLYINRTPNQAEDTAGLIIGLDEITEIPHNPEAARDVVVQFHQTATWEEKLAYVSYPEKVRPLMAEWYAKNPQDITFDRIGFAMDESVTIDDRNFFQVGLIVSREGDNRADARNFVMMVERMPDGEYKVEWETSSGYQPLTLEELKAQKPTTPVEFRLTLEASDFYNFDFQNDQYFAFRGTFVMREEPLFLYGDKDNEAIRAIHNTLQLLPKKGYILKVSYPQNPRTDDQLYIDEVVSNSWFRDYQ